MTELLAPSEVTVESPSVPSAVDGAGLATWTAETMWTASATALRSSQAEIGPSELGTACDRQLAYRLSGTQPVNMTVDPLPSIVGTALHSHMAATFRAMQPPGRYLVEHAVSYMDVHGTVDLYDRRVRTVIDWKFPRKARVRRMLADGVPPQYRWQVQTYAAALESVGESPTRVAVVCIPVDGGLDDIVAFSWPYNLADADGAVGRLHTIRDALTVNDDPGHVKATPTRLCPWCPYHRPHETRSFRNACPGG